MAEVKEKEIDVRARVIDAVRITLGLTEQEASEIALDDLLNKKIGMDELDLIELTMKLEEDLDIEIEDVEEEKITTLRSLVDLVATKVKAGARR